MGNQKKPEVSEGERVIFVPCFRHWRTGQVIHARKFGLEAFRIVVKQKKVTRTK